MKKIGVFEIDHYEMAYALLKVLSLDYEVFLFTTGELKRRLAEKFDHRINWIVLNTGETFPGFYRRMISEINKNQIDLLVINTIEENFTELASELKKTKSKKILTLHNVNFWFRHSNWFLSDSYKANKHKIGLKKEMDAYCVLSDNVKNYLSETYKPKRPVFVFPYSIYEPHKTNTSAEISFAVPGSIDVARRNYDLLLDCFETLHKENYKFSVFFLGFPPYDYGKAIIERSKTLKRSGLQIEYFETLVEQSVFDDLIEKSSFILSPLQLAIRDEHYGKSKETGCFFDMIRYSKPGIVPEYVPVPPQMLSSVLCYSDRNSLLGLLKKIMTDEKLRSEYSKNAQKNSEVFSVENVRKETKKFIESLV